jgi:hypothetical protein
VLAAEKVKPWERLRFDLGGYITNFDSDIQFGSESLGAGINVSVEDALGLDTSTTVLKGGVSYRFTRNLRHQVGLTYYDLSREDSKQLTDDIEINDENIVEGTKIDTKFDLQIIRGDYRYSFFQDDRIDLSLGVGLYVIPIKFRLSSESGGNKEKVVSESITAPLPTLALYGNFAITPKLFLKYGFNFFYLNIGDFKGGILAANLAVEYNFWKHVGFGLGIDRFNLNIEAEGSDYPGIDFVGEVGYQHTGLVLYTKIYF